MMCCGESCRKEIVKFVSVCWLIFWFLMNFKVDMGLNFEGNGYLFIF